MRSEQNISYSLQYGDSLEAQTTNVTLETLFSKLVFEHENMVIHLAITGEGGPVSSGIRYIMILRYGIMNSKLLGTL